MHSKKILHRDIKTLNVFLDDDLNVKLGDMGVAKVRRARYLTILPCTVIAANRNRDTYDLCRF